MSGAALGMSRGGEGALEVGGSTQPSEITVSAAASQGQEELGVDISMLDREGSRGRRSHETGQGPVGGRASSYLRIR